MQFEVSDLLFPGFTKDAMKRLDKQYGIEFFYEFGKDYYWKQKEIEQYIKVGNHPLIIKVEGMMITYGRKV